MKVKYDRERAVIEIILEDEPVLYFDECTQFQFLRPMIAYYSENGEPAKIEIFQKLDERSGKEEDIVIPDSLPWRKYVFTYGNEKYKGCIDSYADIRDSDDLLRLCGSLVIQRRMEKR